MKCVLVLVSAAMMVLGSLRIQAGEEIHLKRDLGEVTLPVDPDPFVPVPVLPGPPDPGIDPLPGPVKPEPIITLPVDPIIPNPIYPDRYLCPRCGSQDTEPFDPFDPSLVYPHHLSWRPRWRELELYRCNVCNHCWLVSKWHFLR